MDLGLVMMHFTKDEGIFRRFWVELISANPQLIKLKNVGMKIEIAVFSGFQSIVCKLLQLYCSRHVQQRDKKAMNSDSLQLTTI